MRTAAMALSCQTLGLVHDMFHTIIDNQVRDEFEDRVSLGGCRVERWAWPKLPTIPLARFSGPGILHATTICDSSLACSSLFYYTSLLRSVDLSLVADTLKL